MFFLCPKLWDKNTIVNQIRINFLNPCQISVSVSVWFSGSLNPDTLTADERIYCNVALLWTTVLKVLIVSASMCSSVSQFQSLTVFTKK